MKTLSLFTAAIMLCTGCGYTLQEERMAHETASDPDYREKYLNTPARFYAEQVKASRLEIFAVKEFTLPRYGSSVRRVADITRNVKRGMEWKAPIRQYGIPFMKKAPVMDGIISGEEWENALELRGEYVLNSEKPLPESSAVWKVGYDKEYLYFAAVFRDPDIISYSAHSFRNEEKPFYRGDSFEIFIRPDLESLHYFEMLQNPAGAEWNMLHVHLNDGRWQMADENFRAYRKIAVRQENGILTYETAVPVRILCSKWAVYGAGANDCFSFMPARCDRNGEAYRQTLPVPLLYDMHNIFGFIQARLLPE